ncbi:MAG: 8-amino-7-oxononanoate synthase [Actinomycetota bacterium]|nr:8-amino-7-oxononanoate synthase [Actinomycetota bacterium]
MTWNERALRLNAETRRAGRWRSPRQFDALGPVGTLAGNTEKVVSFASNDYLGLSAHPLVVEGARDALERWGAGSGAARLIVGSRPVHTELEKRIAEWKSCETALLFPNGFAANLGVLATFGTSGVTIFSDELNHASIVDGCRLARADVVVYPHRDVAALDRALSDSGASIVVTDSVFSMDGDVAPVEELVDVCAKRDALLVLDEAHAVLPSYEEPRGPLLRVGTLSKFLGAFGGFVAGPQELIGLLINRARPFIFTTATSPADAGAALAALEVLRSAEGDALRNRLRVLIDRVAPAHPSPIVPFVIGDEDPAMKASERLLDDGLFVPAIRPPSVPPGTARLRVTLSAAHTDEQVERLIGALVELEIRTVGV